MTSPLGRATTWSLSKADLPGNPCPSNPRPGSSDERLGSTGGVSLIPSPLPNATHHTTLVSSRPK